MPLESNPQAKPARAKRAPAVKRPAPAPRAAGKPVVEEAANAPSVIVDADERRRLIARAAYFRAERRGFAPGGEEADWLEAEREVDALLEPASAAPPAPRVPRRAARSAPGRASS